MGTLALIDVLGRDGSVRQSHKVSSWPLRIGRGLDNDIVVDDPHAAAHHLLIDANEDGVYVAVGDTVNGVHVAGQRLKAGERWQAGAAPFVLNAGRTQLRLRLAEHTLAPEVPLAETRRFAQRAPVIATLVALNLAVLAFSLYLGLDADAFPRDAIDDALVAFVAAAAWCGAWTLMSKLFTHQGHFGWHVRVLATALLAWQALVLVAAAVAFSLSWPWVSGYAFVPLCLLATGTLYLHMQAVEPQRRGLTRTFAVATLAVALGLSGWDHWRTTGHIGSDLYLGTLFSPPLRLAKPVDADTLLDRLVPLQQALDDKARDDD